MTTMGTPCKLRQVDAAQLSVYIALSDEIAAHCAYKTRHGEEYPPKNCAYNQRATLYSRQHTSLQLRAHAWTGFSALMELHRGPVAAFAGICVQPHKYPNVLLSHRLRLYHDARFNLNFITLLPILT